MLCFCFLFFFQAEPPPQLCFHTGYLTHVYLRLGFSEIRALLHTEHGPRRFDSAEEDCTEFVIISSTTPWGNIFLSSLPNQKFELPQEKYKYSGKKVLQVFDKYPNLPRPLKITRFWESSQLISSICLKIPIAIPFTIRISMWEKFLKMFSRSLVIYNRVR